MNQNMRHMNNHSTPMPIQTKPKKEERLGNYK